jgi:hypothetical protein
MRRTGKNFDSAAFLLHSFYSFELIFFNQIIIDLKRGLPAAVFFPNLFQSAGA